jgi:signal transduction histidine kinase
VTQQTEKRFNIISIEDNGIGITTDARNELFKMFKRGNEKSTGIGLGLYIVQTCLKRMGGEILASDCSVGASFKIQLPAND